MLLARCFCCFGLTTLRHSSTWWSFLLARLRLAEPSGITGTELRATTTCTMKKGWISLVPVALGGLAFAFGLWCMARCALLLAISTMPMGMHIFAPDCSSWTRIARATSQRNAVNSFGRMDNAWASRGFTMISRQALRCIISEVRHYKLFFVQGQSSDIGINCPSLSLAP